MNWLSSILGWFASLFARSPNVPIAIVVDIQAATVTLCGFLPVAESVEALVIATYPTSASSIAIVDSVARSICSVVSKAPTPMASAAFLSQPKPTSFIVNGVPIQGRFVS